MRSLVIECLPSCGWWLVQHVTLALKLDSVDGRLRRSRSQPIGCVGGFLQEFDLVLSRRMVMQGIYRLLFVLFVCVFVGHSVKESTNFVCLYLVEWFSVGTKFGSVIKRLVVVHHYPIGEGWRRVPLGR